MIKKAIALACVGFLNPLNLGAWGMRGHTVANLAAVEGITQDGPAFLRAQKAYIGHLGRRQPRLGHRGVRLLRIRAPSSRSASTTNI